MASPYAKSPAVPRSAPRGSSSRSPWAFALPVIAALVLGGLVLVFFVLPIVIRSRCIATAAARGVTLAIDHVDIGLGEVRLVQVSFALDGVSQLSAKATDAQVTLAKLTPVNATVHDLAITIDGPVDTLQAALDEWRANRARDPRASVTASGQKIAFAQGSLRWTKAFGQTATIDAPDVGGEIDAVGGAIHLTTEHLSLTPGSGSASAPAGATLGPWRTTLERDEDGTRTAVELDPVIHGGPSIVYVRSAAGAVSIKANIPRSPLSRIGLPPKALRLGSDPNVEAQIAFDETLSGTASLTASVTLSRAVFSGMPIDATLKLHATGDLAEGLDVKQGTLKAGPLSATVSGTVKLFPDGGRLALAWTARPVPCAELGKELAAQALGGLGSQLEAIAQDAGGIVGLRVAGEARASGLITLDSRDVSATNFTMTANETCGLALF
jgi:hypothetical protein